MRLIPASQIVRAPAREVKAWDEIREDAEMMAEFVTRKFPGLHEAAFALSHCQVSEGIAYAFFVVHPDLVKQKLFRHGTVVVNPKIVGKPDEIRFPGQFPGKVKPKVKNGFTVEEACMSFPFRKPKNCYRYHEVEVEYQTPGLFGLKTRRETLTGLASHIFQHECDHAEGRNIYHKD